MQSTLQNLMFIMFVLTVVLVLLAEFGTNIQFKRAMALASIATVSTAIAALVRDPPKAGDWPTMTWEVQGKTAKKKQTRTAYVRDEDDEAEKAADTVVEKEKARFSEGDAASERLERMVVMAFKSPRDLGPSAGDKVRDCEACPELVLVPAGTSRVGGDDGDRFATRAELPQRVVRIWPGFMMGRSEVTAAEYRAFTRATGRAMRTCPVADDTAGSGLASCVTQDDALACVAWLRRVTGKSYRLPSAAEWEYAARAEQAGWAGHPVVSRVAYAAAATAHPWGLQGLGGGRAFDSGLAERTADCWNDNLSRLPANGEAFVPDPRCSHHVLKDGVLKDDALKDGASAGQRLWARPSARRPIDRHAASHGVGFRVVRSVE